MIKPRLRKPRFVRSPDKRPLLLTERDVCILTLADRHRAIRSDHLFKLVRGSRQHLLRRLQRLFHAGYLERPRVQLAVQGETNAHFAYTLALRGLNELRARSVRVHASPPRFDSPASVVAWSHTLRVTDVMAAVEAGASTRALKFILHHDWKNVRDDARDESTLHTLRWFLKFRHRGQRLETSIIPDSAFAGQNADGIRRTFLLEVDRGTMPVRRSDFAQSSFLKKIIAYKETRNAGILWKRFGVSGFRVLVVAESERRLASLRAAAAECFRDGESSMFLFITATDLLMADDGFGPHWRTCSGRNISLFPA